LTDTPSDTPLDSVSEAKIISFIVRVWREEVGSQAKSSIWRGHITCIPDGPRRYFANLSEIGGLIGEYTDPE
jgi:hypothetical protein